MDWSKMSRSVLYSVQLCSYTQLHEIPPALFGILSGMNNWTMHSTKHNWYATCMVAIVQTKPVNKFYVLDSIA